MTFYFSTLVYICDIISPSISSFKMNASSWRKAADLVAQETQVNQQVQAVAMAESTQLESLPLSALSADDSSLPHVTYVTEQPLTTSTPRATSTSIPETQTTDTHREIIPGMSEHLYPTLVADASLNTPVADNCSTLQNQITSEIDKYLQEAAERHERDDNYFDRWHVGTNTSSPQQEANFLEQDEEDDEVQWSGHWHVWHKSYRTQHSISG